MSTSDLTLLLLCECPGDIRALTAAGLVLMREQLQSFITGVGSALCTVTTLTLMQATEEDVDADDAPWIDDEVPLAASISNMLAQLAPACPALVNLHLYGLIYDNDMQAIGAACPHLTHMEVSPNCLQIQTLQRLTLFLPHVWSLTLCELNLGDNQSHQAYIRNAVTALAACTSVTRLCITDDGVMEQVMWAHLPPSLECLIAHSGCKEANGESGVEEGPSEGVYLPRLAHVFWDSDIQGVVRLLRAAPNLQQLDITMHVKCSPRLLPSWDAFCARKDAGLCGTTTLILYNDGGSQLSHFLSAVQPMPSVTEVAMEASDSSINTHDEDCLAHVSRVFPHLEDLTLAKLTVSNESLHALVRCSHLRTIRMQLCHLVKGEGVALMAVSCPSLENLRLIDCKKVSSASVVRLEGLLQLYGKQVNQ